MLSRVYSLFFLVLRTSCSLFQSQNIQNEKVETLINYIEGEGEGRGRLGINQHQYLISYEAVLKENHDWILAASIPLHGEEVLLLRDLKQETLPESNEGLELRIQQGINDYLRSQNQSPELSRTFLVEFRRLMRMVFYKELGLRLDCQSNQCRLDGSVYQVEATDKQITLKKSLSEDYEIEFVATNLTDSIFKRSNVFLHSKNKSPSSTPLLSLELFWK